MKARSLAGRAVRGHTDRPPEEPNRRVRREPGQVKSQSWLYLQNGGCGSKDAFSREAVHSPAATSMLHEPGDLDS